MSDAMQTSRPTGRGGEPSASAERGRIVGHLIFNGLLALLCVFLFLHAKGLPSSAWEPIGSGTFPRLLLGITFLLNLTIMLKEGRKLSASTRLAPGTVRDWLWQHRLAFGVLGLFAVYAATLPYLGYRWATLPFVLFVQILLGARDLRGVAIALTIALVMSLGMDILFREVFTISLPRGVLG